MIDLRNTEKLMILTNLLYHSLLLLVYSLTIRAVALVGDPASSAGVVIVLDAEGESGPIRALAVVGGHAIARVEVIL